MGARYERQPSRLEMKKLFLTGIAVLLAISAAYAADEEFPSEAPRLKKYSGRQSRAIKTGGTRDQAAELLAIVLERLSRFRRVYSGPVLSSTLAISPHLSSSRTAAARLGTRASNRNLSMVASSS